MQSLGSPSLRSLTGSEPFTSLVGALCFTCDGIISMGWDYMYQKLSGMSLLVVVMGSFITDEGIIAQSFGGGWGLLMGLGRGFGSYISRIFLTTGLRSISVAVN